MSNTSNTKTRFRIVVDTNIVVAAFISRKGAPFRLSRRWLLDPYTLLVTPDVVEEYRDVLSRPRFARQYGATPWLIGAYLGGIEAIGEAVTPIPRNSLPVTVEDIKDEHILAAALGGGATHA